MTPKLNKKQMKALKQEALKQELKSEALRSIKTALTLAKKNIFLTF
jgi:hypothetical protein